MREIKFRGYHPVEGLLNPEELRKIGLSLTFDGQVLFGDNACESRWVLTQYTGLKDCNGVEIFEGDIVHWGHIEGYKERLPRKAVVEFSPELAFKTFNLGENNHRFGFSNFIYKNTHQAMEVIGNIFENPGVLNDD